MVDGEHGQSMENVQSNVEEEGNGRIELVITQNLWMVEGLVEGTVTITEIATNISVSICNKQVFLSRQYRDQNGSPDTCRTQTPKQCVLLDLRTHWSFAHRDTWRSFHLVSIYSKSSFFFKKKRLAYTKQSWEFITAKEKREMLQLNFNTDSFSCKMLFAKKFKD